MPRRSILALYALGQVDTLDVVADMVGATHRHVPIPENVAVYAKLTPIYMSIPAKLAEDYARIVAFQQGVGTARPA